MISLSAGVTTNKNVLKERDTKDLNGSRAEKDYDESSSFSKEIDNKAKSKFTTISHKENGGIHQNSSVDPNHVVLTSKLTKIENVKNSLTQITQV